MRDFEGKVYEPQGVFVHWGVFTSISRIICQMTNRNRWKCAVLFGFVKISDYFNWSVYKKQVMVKLNIEMRQIN